MSTGAVSLVDREVSVRYQQTRVRQVDLTESDRAVIPGLSAYDLMCRWLYGLTCRSRGGVIMASAALVR
jgi:hypothetical protein